MNYAEQRLNAVLHGMPLLLLEVGQDGTYAHLDGGALAGLDLSPESVIGRPVEAVHADDRHFLTNARLALRGLAFDDDVPFKERWWRIRYSPRLGADGRPDGFRAVAIDISARKRADQAQETLMATLAHDLRTPLSAIQLHAAVLDRFLAGAATNISPAAVIDNIRRAVANADRLLAGLLDYAQMQTGSLMFHPTVEPLTALLQDAIARATAAANERGAALSFDPPAACSLVCDRERLTQALSAMIVRAIQLAPMHAVIEVGARTAEGRIAVTVTMPPDEHGTSRATALEMFRPRLSAGHKASDVGLSTSAGIIEAHGGCLRLERPRAGGAELHIALPLA